MKPTLEDYGDFADKIGLSAIKKDGVFKYVHKETGIEVKPYQLGALYKLFLSKYIEGVEYSANHFEHYCKQKSVTKETLPKAFSEELSSQKTYIQELKKSIK